MRAFFLVPVVVGLSALAAQAQTNGRRIEIGVHCVGLSAHVDRFPIPPSTDIDDLVFGGGARVGYNITQRFAVEAEGSVFQRPPTSDPATRGRWAQGFFGLKVAKRLNKLSIFAKMRPGFSRFDGITSVMSGRNGMPEINPIKDNSFFALDAGGGIEFYPSRRTIVRFDASDVIIRYTNRPGENFNVANPVRKTFYGHSLRVSIGFAFRF
jgi:opacity protein-like surface antigen